MNFQKVWLISVREFTYNFRRKSYLFAAFVVPLLIAGLTFFVIQFVADSETDISAFSSVGYVDPNGVLGAGDRGDFPRYQAYESEATARAAFDSDDIQAYFVLGEDYFSSGNVAYYSDKSLKDALRTDFQDFVRTQIATDTPTIERLIDPINLKVQLLSDESPLSEEGAILRFALPIGLGFMFVFNVLMSSQFLMTGIVEEKENHILEILASSCRPVELITGKVLGLGGLALLQVAFWGVAGVVIGLLTGRLDILKEASFEPWVILVTLLYFILTFLLFAGIMVGIGAVVSAEQESRQLAAVFTMITILPPTWGLALFLDSPKSPIVTFLSIFPLTSPMSMMILIGLGEAEPWQILLSLSLLIITIMAILWAAARIFRLGMLMSGQRLSLRRLGTLLRG